MFPTSGREPAAGWRPPTRGPNGARVGGVERCIPCTLKRHYRLKGQNEAANAHEWRWAYAAVVSSIDCWTSGAPLLYSTGIHCLASWWTLGRHRGNLVLLLRCLEVEESTGLRETWSEIIRVFRPIFPLFSSLPATERQFSNYGRLPPASAVRNSFQFLTHVVII